MNIRRTYMIVEETFKEGGRELEKPLKRVAAAAVIENPAAGEYVEDLSELMDIGEQLGDLLANQAVAALVGDMPESYGKAAIVGMDGDQYPFLSLHGRVIGDGLVYFIFVGPPVWQVGGIGPMFHNVIGQFVAL